MLPVLFRYQRRLIITEAVTIDIATMGITTHTAITGTTIGTALGLSASTGAQVITAIGKRSAVPTSLTIITAC